MLRFGMIGSAGGSSFFSALDCMERSQTDVSATVVVNRACGLSDRCTEQSVPWTRIAYTNRQSFSSRCAEHFLGVGIRHVILFYDRLLQAAEFEAAGIQVFNIHPSLLPSFPGMNAVEQAYRHGVRMVGSTLHRIDEGVDTGPIEAQVCSHLTGAHGLGRVQTISYLQKTYLNLVWFDLLSNVQTRSGVECNLKLIDCTSHTLANPSVLERFNALCSLTLPDS
ncbi:formyltransferase family protein [Rhodopirellula sp. P2]|uniref:formyltransferase family protein n=1 Tax=Rhodopirellula sp. P2 TaxID=2127060 RepID=UPI003FCF12D4